MLRSRARRCSIRLPRRDISPLSGVSRPAINRSVVLLPLPEGPNRTSVSPAPMEKFTSSRTRSEPNHLHRPRTTTDGRALVSGAAQSRVAGKEATILAISHLTFDRGLRIAGFCHRDHREHREGKKERNEVERHRSAAIPPTLFPSVISVIS